MSAALTTGALRSPSSSSRKRPCPSCDARDPLPVSPAISLLAPSVPATPVAASPKTLISQASTPAHLAAADAPSRSTPVSSATQTLTVEDSPSSSSAPSRAPHQHAEQDPVPVPTASSSAEHHSGDQDESRPPKRPRVGRDRQSLANARILSMVVILEDFAELNAEQERIGDPTVFDASEPAAFGALDALLYAAAPSPSVAVCATLYMARMDRVAIPVTLDNILALTAAALVVAARYVDRENVVAVTARVAAAVGVPSDGLDKLVDEFKEALPSGTYISLSSFREFEELLDNRP